MAKRILVCVLAAWVWIAPLKAQTEKEIWVDSIFTRMSTNDKIGQLFILSTSAEKDQTGLNDLDSKIRAGLFGGILFTKGKTLTQAHLTNKLQSLSRIPLLIAADGSSGLGKSLDSALTFPSQLAQGAITNDSLIFLMGKEVGRQMKRMGINVNFISANIASPQFAASYGENRFAVTEKSLAYWRGIQSQGILACAKYFPIHGITISNPPKGVNPLQLRVDSTETYPFKVLFKKQIPAVMLSHTELPLFYSKKKTRIRSLFSGAGQPPAFAGDWVRKNMQYEGLIITDARQMGRSSDKFSPGDAELFAFQAGSDLMITSSNIGAAFRKTKKFLRKQKSFLPQLDRSVKKILALKYDADLAERKNIQPNFLLQELVPVEIRKLSQKMYHSAITALANQNNSLPVQSLEDKNFICVVAGDSVKGRTFASRLSKYVQTNTIHVTERTQTFDLTDTLRPRQVVIVALFPGTKETTLSKLLPVLKEENSNREVIICDFGSPIFRPYASDFPSVITAYSDEYEMLISVPEIVFGGISSEGVSPLTFGKISVGTSFKTNTLDRLTYSFPEDAGMDGPSLDKIESIAKEAIEIGATPGCHVLIAKEGKIVYEKSFGYFTYENQDAVTDQTIYDLASVTKVTATLQTVMFMHEKGLIDINKKISVYLPELKTSNKKDFIIKDILTHQAGLWPGLPFWAQTMKESRPLPLYYNDSLSAEYPLVVSDNLFAARSMKDSLWSWIVKAKIREKPQRTPFDYRYSDMGFYILQHLAERILNQPIEDFLAQNLYEPLGASTTGYLPLLRYSIHQIAPTENDKLFRKSLLIGTVHDQGAAMQGGIAGHAGLFSNANDLAKLGQMLLQEGQYGGTQYYSPQTVRFFTQKQFEKSRRGLGWDKPTPGDWNGPTSYSASPKTFGHTGFTGTCIWVDPEFKLVYIFLSNRVHPDMTNNKLLSANIRSRIQDVIYQSIFNYCKTAGSQPEFPDNVTLGPVGRRNK